MKKILLLALVFSSLSFSSFGQSANFTTSISSNPIPNLNCGGTVVSFTIDDLTGVNSYEWDFGNGAILVSGNIPADSPDGSASSTFINAQDYTVTLTVNGSTTTSQVITIAARPQPSFTTNQSASCLESGAANFSFTYDGTIPTGGASIETWIWNFGDGSGDVTLTAAGGSNGNTTHTYSTAGIYDIFLQVIDANGCTQNYFEVQAVTVHGEPTAAFNYSIPPNCSFPISVQLNDISTVSDNSISFWTWTAVEQSAPGTVVASSTLQNPMLSFANPGIYDVTLEVTTSPGTCTDIVTQSISLQENTTSFTQNNNAVCANSESITFTNTSIDGNGGIPTAFAWDFGDGSTSTDENPTHIYTDLTGGTYDVSLTVTYSNGCEESMLVQNAVTVFPLLQTTIIPDQASNCEDYTVNFTGTTGATLYEWDFDNNGVFETTGNSNTESFTYTGEGSFTALLRTTTADGCIETATTSIDITFPEPVFTVSSGDEGCLGVTAFFDASASINNLPIGNESITNYAWDFGDGNTSLTNANANASHNYLTTGTFDVTLTITTAEGCIASITMNSAVKRGDPPTPSITAATNECVDVNTTFTNASIAGSTPIDSVIWSINGVAAYQGSPQDFITAFDLPATYTITLEAFSLGCSGGSTDQMITIDQPHAEFTADAGGNTFLCSDPTGTAFVFDATSSTGVEQYRWDFGDGTLLPLGGGFTTGTDPTTSHTYSVVGDYTVTLTVQNLISGCTDTFTSTINVSTGAVDFIADDGIQAMSQQVCLNQNIILTNNSSTNTSSSVTYDWNFGAGASPASNSVNNTAPQTVSYTTPGLKTITLTLTEANGCVRTLTRTAYIDVRGPIPSFSIDNALQCIAPSAPTIFTSTSDASTSVASSNNTNTNQTYTWNFGAGATPANITASNEDPINVIYSTSGIKTVTLTVTDNEGCSATITDNVNVQVPEVIADFDFSATSFCSGQTVTFTDNSTADVGTIASYNWNFGNNASPTTATGPGPHDVVYSPNIAAPASDLKTITLTITTTDGCTGNYMESVEIYEPNSSFTVPTGLGCAPTLANFTNTSTDAVSYLWDFGDGNTSTEENPSHRYLFPGLYDVSLTTTNAGGCETTTISPASASVDGPFFDTFEYSPEVGCLLDPTNPVVTYTITGLVDTKVVDIDYGDGIVEQVVFADVLNPTDPLVFNHTYATRGSFVPILTLTDDISQLGSCGSFQYKRLDNDGEPIPIVISEKPTPSFSFETQTGNGCEDVEIQFTDETQANGGINDNRFPITAYSWDYGDGTPVETGFLPNPTHTFLNQGMYNVTMMITTEIGCAETVSMNVEILPELIDNTIGTTQTICAGDTPTLDADGTGDGSTAGQTLAGGDSGSGYTFLWQTSTNQINWTNAPGTNNLEDYTLVATNPTAQTTNYFRRQVNSGSCFNESAVFTVLTDPTSNGGTLTNDATECFGINDDILSVSGIVGQILEWQSDDNPSFTSPTTITNTSNTLSYNNLTSTTYYRVLVQSGVCPTGFSNTVSITVLDEIANNTLTGSTSICSDEDPATITGTTPTGGGGSFTYQWQSSTTSAISGFNNIALATNEDFDPSILSQTTWYRRIATSGNSCTDISNVVEINVTNNPITTNSIALVDNTRCDNQTMTVRISNSENGYTYNVLDVLNGMTQVGTGTGNGGTLSIVIAQSDLPDNTGTSGSSPVEFQIQVINDQTASGGIVCTETYPANLTGSIDAIPDISLNVVNDGDVCNGDSWNITIENAEAGNRYRLENTSNGNSLVDQETTSTAGDVTLTATSSDLPASGQFNFRIRVRSDNANRACHIVLTNGSGSINVIATPSDGLTVSDPFVCEENLPSTASVTVSNSQTNVSYQLKNGATNVGSAVLGTGGDINLTIPSGILTTNTYNVFATATQLDGSGTSCDEVQLSDDAELTVIPNPTISYTVSDPTVCEEDLPVIINVSGSQSNTTYRLKTGGASGTVIQTRSGNGSAFTFNPSPSVSTNYTITAQSTLNGSACSEFTLTDLSSVTIIETPDNSNSLVINDFEYCEEDASSTADLVFTVTNTESGYNYELKNNLGTTIQTLAGNNGTLTFNGITPPTSSQVYTVDVTPIATSDAGVCNTLTLTDTGVITVAPIPTFNNTLPVSDPNICEGNTATIVVQNTELGISYQLRLNDNDALIGSAIAGTGGDINFDVSPITSTDYNILATATSVAGCQSRELIDLANVVVIPTPNNSLNITQSETTACSGEAITITIENTASNVSYQLRNDADNSLIAGQVFSGNGANQSFTVSPASSISYNVLAQSTLSDSDGANCNAIEMNTIINVTIEGPITIDTDVSDQTICSDATLAQFIPEISNPGAGTLSFQWQENTGSGFVSLSDNATYSGSNSEILTIFNPVGLVGNQYQLMISSAECSTITTATGTLLLENTPNVTGLNVNLDDVCQGDSNTANISGNLSDGTYVFTYSISGSNSASNLTSTVMTVGGAGTLNLASTDINNEGSNVFVITEVAFNSGEGCSVNSLSVSDNFDVEANPNTTGLAVSINNTCPGEDAIVGITGSLINGAYQITYNLTGTNTATGLTANITLSAGDGSGSFIIPNTNLTNPGNTNVIVTDINFSTGKNCAVGSLTTSGSFTIEELPITTGLAINLNDICANEDLIVNITSSLLDDTYNITYEIGGSNIANLQNTSIATIGGNGNFTIDASNIPNTGNSTVTITSIANNGGQQCEVNGLSITDDFNIEDNPIISGLTVSLSNICESNDAVANMTSNLIDGSYVITYNLSGTNNATGLTANTTISSGDGNTTFIVPSTRLNNTGTTSLTITSIAFASGQNCSNNLTATGSFDIEANPIVAGLATSVSAICEGQNAVAMLSGNLADGSYIITYDLSAPNIATGITAAITLSNGNGTGDIIIAGSNLNNAGNTTMTITSVRYVTGEQCEVNGLSITETFTVEPTPNTTTLSLAATDVCENNDLNVMITSSLSDGTYDFIYDLTGSNSTTGLTASVIISGGTGSGTLTIPGTNLLNDGPTTITITAVSNTAGLTCPANSIPSAMTSFNVEPDPITNGMTVAISDICVGNSGTAFVSSNLLNGSYLVTYNISGNNTAVGLTQTELLTTSNGNFEINLAASNLTNTGNSAITITSVAYTTGQMCEVSGLNVTNSFDVEPLPNTTTVNLSINDICPSENAIVNISSSLLTGSYDIEYNLSGTNTANDLIANNVAINSGAGSFIVNNDQLTNTGNNTITITDITYTTGQNCTQTGLTATNNFQIESSPITTGLSVSIGDICEGENATANITGNLTDGNYQFTYSLSGSNTANGLVVNSTFSNGDGTGSFIIPTANIASTGNTNVIITEVTYTTGQMCSAQNLLVINNFDIESIPDVSTLNLNANNICFGSDATINLTSSLTNGDYQLTYNLSGVNNAIGLTTNITINTGDGISSFVLPASNIINSGVTQVTITDLQSNSGQNCQVSSLTNSTSFEAEELPDSGSMGISTSTICQGNDAIVAVSGLASGSYLVTYDLSTANTAIGLTSSLTIGGGSDSFTIPQANLLSDGLTTITISEISLVSGEQCGVDGLAVSTGLIIEPTPILSNLAISSQNSCSGEDATVNITSDLVDGDYQITYNLSGENTANNLTENINLSNGDGTGSFDILSSNLTQVGITSITITSIDYMSGENCSSNTISISTDLAIEAIPNITSLNVSVGDICFGSDATANLSGNLQDGTYQITYDLPGNTGVVINTTIAGGSGNGSFNIDASEILSSGNNSLTITDISNTLGQQCAVNSLTISDTFNATVNPDVTSLSVDITNICEGNDAIANLSGNLTDGSYQITYNLSGENIISNLSANAVLSNGDGTGNFDIPAANLTNSGTTSVTITSINFSDGLFCSENNLTISNSFDVEVNPNTNGLMIDIENQCNGIAPIVNMTSNLIDGSYLVTYNLSGSNSAIGLTANITISTSDGNSSFNLPLANLTNDGITTLTITSIAFTTGQMCEVNSLSVNEDFTVEDLPITAGLAISLPTVCEDEIATANISGGLVDGDYLFSYQLSGAHINNNLQAVGSITGGSGNGSFIIPASELTDAGTTTVTITEIAFTDGKNCTVNGLTVSGDLISESKPNTNSLTATIQNICPTEDATAIINGNLEDGNYNITYNLSGANTSIGTVINVNITGGNGQSTFIIPSSSLANTGTTDLTITDISFTSGESCVETGLSLVASFEIEELPNTTSLVVNVGNTCQDNSATANLSGNLVDGDYSITFNLSGANIASGLVATSTLTSSNGTGNFSIPESSLTAFGNTVLTITDISFNSGQNCLSTGLSITDNFTVERNPITTNLSASINNICQGSDATVNLSGDLLDGEYQLTYHLNGVNVENNLSTNLSLSNSDGTGSFTIPNTHLSNTGNVILVITEIVFTTGEMCSTNNLAINTNFEVEENPTVTGLSLSTNDICLGNDQTISINSNLIDGNYLITYNIVGDNSVNDLTTNLVVSNNNGTGNFIIDQSTFANTGSSAVVVTAIQFTNGETCAITGLNASSNLFNIGENADISTLDFSVLSPICRGNSSTLTVTGLTANTNYHIGFNNNGSTEIESVTTDADGNANLTTQALTADGSYNITSVELAGLTTSCQVQVSLTAKTVDVGCNPISANRTVITNEDVNYNFEQSDFSFSDPDSDLFQSVILTSLPTNGTLFYNDVIVTINDVTTASDFTDPSLFTFSPNLHENGTSYSSFTFKVKDNSGDLVTNLSIDYTITIDVIPTQDEPTVMDVSVMVNEDDTLVFQPTSFMNQFMDIENSPLTKIRIDNLPSDGILYFNGLEVTPGQEIDYLDISLLNFIPNQDFNGNSTFNWSGFDGTDYSTATAAVNIIVNPTNDQPIAQDDANIANESVPAIGNVLGNDTDIDNDILSVTLLPNSGPLEGDLTINEDGTYTYIPDGGFNGIDSFEYVVCDNGTPTLCDTARVIISVQEIGLDSDGDGIPDNVEVGDDPGNPIDSDNDGTPDYLDLDSDNDGIADEVEAGNTPSTPVDTDNDNVPDYLDNDADNDGVADWEESGSEVAPSGMDSDNDGIDDAFETSEGGPGLNFNPRDSDNDGTDDYRDTDDDNDGVNTADEDINNDTSRTNDDTDGDGIPNYLDMDDDNDGVPSSEEDIDNDGTPEDDDSDEDGIPDYLDTDDDGDGIPTTDEDINDDDDPTNDDTDGDGIPNYLDTDSDGDGILDENEDIDGDGDPTNDDTDGDGVPNYLDTDDDGDGILTKEEDHDEDGNPSNDDTDGDGTPDYLDTDDDDDGIPTEEEDHDNDGNPTNDDTDGDGIPDYLDTDDDGDGIPTEEEDRDDDGNPANDDTDGDGTPDYLDTDDDGDGIPTEEEDHDNDGNPANDDTDGDGTPDYLDTDDDNDGVPTKDEDINNDGDPTNDDTDGDGTPNHLDTDDDGDGVPTTDEDVNSDEDPTNDDSDGDGTPDYLDTDDDGDGILTEDEDANNDGDPTNDDNDGDGNPNYLDNDSDNDGVSDMDEDRNNDGNPDNDDSDGDGTPDYLDTDDDEDGVPTEDEDRNNDGDPTNDDTDGDGTPDYLDTDDDEDGVPTEDEDRNNDSDPTNDDTDGDGIPDYLDTDDDEDGILTEDEDLDNDGDPTNDDSDGDGIPNYLDTDDDGDGVPTEDEDTNGDGDPTNDDNDGDGIPNYLDTDDDGDGVPTEEEDVDNDGDPTNDDSDGDGIPNYLDTDDDGDGVPTEDEDTNGDGDPTNDDTDGDGIPNYLDTDDDGDGVSTEDEDTNSDGDPTNDDSDGDGIPNYLDTDDDGDGVSTEEEDTNGDGDPTNDDTDGDGIPNYLDTDDDGDGVSTEDEDTNGDGDPTNDDADGDGIPNYLDTDDDGDGVPTEDEDTNGDGDPTNDDSDGDGIPNYLDTDDDGDGIPTEDEDTNGDGDPTNDDSDGDGIPNYLDTDDDGDGIPTKEEDLDNDGDPTNDDSDGDGIPNYLDTDDDGDGVPTEEEDVNNDGDPANDDSDGDGIPNYLDTDDDGDGIPTEEEDLDNDGDPTNDDSDGDGIPNYLDTDDDGDGIPTEEEDLDNDGDPTNDDSDGDGIPNYLDTDDDGDGVPTEEEDVDNDGDRTNDDTDGDGIPNYLDTDDDGDGVPTEDEDVNEDEDPQNDDTDGDGTPNYLDTDDDGDGVPTEDEDLDNDGDPTDDDSDGDNIPEYLDISTDEDGDGKDDILEGTEDCDGDGIPNFQDPDDACQEIPLTIPNVFTPNGDGINDVFLIEGIEDYPNNTVKIFNRWGNSIYEIRGYNNRDKAWRSDTNTKLVIGNGLVPDGTYFYVIDLGDGSKPFSGYIVVNR